jgi:hypothetical protein
VFAGRSPFGALGVAAVDLCELGVTGVERLITQGLAASLQQRSKRAGFGLSG